MTARTIDTGGASILEAAGSPSRYREIVRGLLREATCRNAEWICVSAQMRHMWQPLYAAAIRVCPQCGDAVLWLDEQGHLNPAVPDPQLCPQCMGYTA